MTKLDNEERDYFTDTSVLKDPYSYFQEMHSKCPVHQLKNRDILMVTGFEEALEVLKNTQDFSSIVSTQGAHIPLLFEPQGDDISKELEAHRDQMPAANLLVAYDDARHTAARGLLNRLFTPSRLKANEEYMWSLADRLVKEAVAKGGCDLIAEIATPYVTLVIADLLGVPADDREAFRIAIDEAPPPGNMESDEEPTRTTPLEFMAGYFYRYIVDRRANPRGDVLTQLATVTYPDGSMPDISELVKLAAFIFGAGQDTSAKLLGNSLRFLVEDPALQKQLRDNRELIPAFLEEVLRLEGSSKATFRVARKKTRIADKEVPAGKRVVVALAAANRDPRRWESPTQFKLDRPRAKEHVAFGRGAHVCAGAPLARAEIRIVLDRFLEHTSDIRLSQLEHGKPGSRRLDYEPSFIIRGLSKLHLELSPAR